MYVELRNTTKVYGLTDEQVRSLKDYLTFDNPAYKSAKRYSKSRYISIPMYLYYFKEGKDYHGSYVEVPIGVDIEKFFKYHINPMKHEGDGGLLSRNCPQVDYPEFKLELRPIQQEALDAYTSLENNSGLFVPRKSLISLPTGKGKTILAIALAAKLRTRALVLVHKDDLVDGWQKDIDLCFGGVFKPGLIKAKKREIGKYITIATVQTLSRMSAEELSKYTEEFGLVIQDECHHVGLNIFNIINEFNSSYKLGLSATPTRSDGLNFVFDLFFGGICYEYKATQDDEDICNVEVEVLDSGFVYKPFLLKGQVFNYNDFKPSELPKDIMFLEDIPYQNRPAVPFSSVDNQAVMSSKTKVPVCKKILEHYRKGHSVLVLFSQKEHINSYYRYLSLYMPKEEIMLYYGDNKEKTSVLKEKAESKEVLVTLATLAKSTEGTNVKAWEVEFLVSSMKDEKNVEQATGRIRRVKEGKLNPAKVYDVRYSQCYSLSNHYRVRKEVYEKLGYTIKDPKPVMPKGRRNTFSRGYVH